MAQLICIWSVCNSASSREVLRQHFNFILQVGLLQLYCVSLLFGQKVLCSAYIVHTKAGWELFKKQLRHSIDCFTVVQVQRQTILMFRLIWQLDTLGFKLRHIKASSRPRAELAVPVLLPLGAHLWMPSLLYSWYQADLPILAGASSSSSSPVSQPGKHF